MGWRDRAPDEWAGWARDTVRMIDHIARTEGENQAVTVAVVLARTIPVDVDRAEVDVGLPPAPTRFGAAPTRLKRDRDEAQGKASPHMTPTLTPRTMGEQMAAYRAYRADRADRYRSLE